jgi:hypothetical protein
LRLSIGLERSSRLHTFSSLSRLIIISRNVQLVLLFAFWSQFEWKKFSGNENDIRWSARTRICCVDEWYHRTRTATECLCKTQWTHNVVLSRDSWFLW